MLLTFPIPIPIANTTSSHHRPDLGVPLPLSSSLPSSSSSSHDSRALSLPLPLPLPLPLRSEEAEPSRTRSRLPSSPSPPPPPMSTLSILVTGGAGYIGSHTVLQLLLSGCRVAALDNLDNSSDAAISRVTRLAGDAAHRLSFHKIDLRDRPALEQVFSSNNFDAVIHFAGSKAVGESVAKPLLYYNNNLISTIILLEVMAAYGCKKLVFSSSASVYGSPERVPCTEDFPLAPVNPYGQTKLMAEDICRDLHRADPEWKIMLLRYFNPVGAHPSGLLGEDPRGIPNNLMPYVQQVAVGRRPALTVFGNDYSTKDGTGIRDYIHVVDLADGHKAALNKLFEEDSKIGCEAYNLGTGKGTSVLEIVSAFEKASGKKIPLVFGERRPGDCEILYAATTKAETQLKWKAKYGIEEMCRDQWNWACNNPYGYSSSESNGEMKSSKSKESSKSMDSIKSKEGESWFSDICITS